MTFCDIIVKGVPTGEEEEAVDVVDPFAPDSGDLVHLSSASASSVYDSQHSAGNPINVPFDINYDGEWYDLSPSSCVDTNHEVAWWNAIFSMGQHAITHVNLLPSRQSWGADLQDAYVWVGNTLCGQVPSDMALGTWFSIECAADSVGSDVHIQLADEGYLTICGIKVYGSLDDRELDDDTGGDDGDDEGRDDGEVIEGDPVLELTDAYASSEYDDAHYSGAPIFEDYDPYFDGEWYNEDPSSCFDSNSEHAWWTARLVEGQHEVSKVSILNSRQSWGSDIAWAEVYVGDMLCGYVTSNPVAGEWLEVECAAGTIGSRVAIELDSIGYLTFCGIRVQGVPDDSDVGESDEWQCQRCDEFEADEDDWYYDEEEDDYDYDSAEDWINENEYYKAQIDELESEWNQWRWEIPYLFIDPNNCLLVIGDYHLCKVPNYPEGYVDCQVIDGLSAEECQARIDAEAEEETAEE